MSGPIPTCSSDDREAWLEARTRYITASDVGTILGFNKYKTPAQLFHEKISGKREVFDPHHMVRGQLLEEWIISTCPQFEPNKILFQSENFDWLAATPDGLITQPSTYSAKLLEIKCHESFITRYGKEKIWPDENYVWQVKAQLVVMGQPTGLLLGYAQAQDKVKAAFIDLCVDDTLLIRDKTYSFWASLQNESLALEFL